jgi:hypothetical protein
MMREVIATKRNLKLNNHPEFSITIGTMNKKNPNSLYITASSWLYLGDGKRLDNKSVCKLTKKIKNHLYNSNDLIFNSKNIICDISYPNLDNGKNIDKLHFFDVDITLFQKDYKNLLDWKDDNLFLYTDWIAEEIISLLKNEGFSFFNSRKSKLNNLSYS